MTSTADCATNGLSRTVIGDDRKDKMSSDEKTASKYNKKNRKLWRANCTLTREGTNPLAEAAMDGNIGVAKLLLDAGADVNCVSMGPYDWGRVTALDISRRNSFAELAAELTARGAKSAAEMQS